MVVKVDSPDDGPARRPSTRDVREATPKRTPPGERAPFSREYLNYWVPLPEAPD